MVTAFGKFPERECDIEYLDITDVDTSCNRIIVDWFSFTSPTLGVEDIKHLLGLDRSGIDWLVMPYGRYGYHFFESFQWINIYYGGAPGMGVMLEMSGKGCRSFEEFGSGDWVGLFNRVLKTPDIFRIKRLDVAYDDFESVFDLSTMCKAVSDRYYISKWRNSNIVESCHDGLVGKSFVLGSRSSDILMRTYDKKVEQKSNLPHWVRMELQMREQNALAFIASFRGNEVSFGEVFKSCISQYVRFVKREDGCDDSNKSRWSSPEWWDKFLGSVSDCFAIDKPGVDYSFSQFENTIARQFGQAIQTYIDLEGLEGLSDLLSFASDHFKPNIKYKFVSQQHALHEGLLPSKVRSHLRKMRLCEVYGDYEGYEHYKNLYDIYVLSGAVKSDVLQ